MWTKKSKMNLKIGVNISSVINVKLFVFAIQEFIAYIDHLWT